MKMMTEADLLRMKKEYDAVIGHSDTEVSEEQMSRLWGLDGNLFACRKLFEIHLAEGDLETAEMELAGAACMGDEESIRQLFTDGRFDCPTGLSFYQEHFLHDVYWNGGEMEGMVNRIGREEPAVAEAILMWCWIRHQDMGRYSQWVGECLSNGSSKAMFTEAWETLCSGFDGIRVERLDIALSLMERSAETFWRASMFMAILHYVGRYVERDEEKALRYVEHALMLASEDVSEMWYRFLTYDYGPDEGPEVDDMGVVQGFDLFDIPEWTVLQDMTYTWGNDTLFSPFRNGQGGFENEVFWINPMLSHLFGGDRYVPEFMFKPTGLCFGSSVNWRMCHMSEPVTKHQFQDVLRICIDSARDSVRGLGI